MPDGNRGASILCEPTPYAVKMHMDMSQQAFCAEIHRENVANPGAAHGHVTGRGILWGNLLGKCRTLIPGQAFCASLRSRNAHGHVTRCILWGNLSGKCRTGR